MAIKSWAYPINNLPVSWFSPPASDLMDAYTLYPSAASSLWTNTHWCHAPGSNGRNGTYVVGKDWWGDRCCTNVHQALKGCASDSSTSLGLQKGFWWTSNVFMQQSWMLKFRPDEFSCSLLLKQNDSIRSAPFSNRIALLNSKSTLCSQNIAMYVTICQQETCNASATNIWVLYILSKKAEKETNGKRWSFVAVVKRSWLKSQFGIWIKGRPRQLILAVMKL